MTLHPARHLSRLLATVLLSSVVTATPAHASAVDGYSGYEPQQTCTSAPKPGTEYLLRWLLGRYPGTGSSGTLRPCDSGGQSEHKDGRALDWAVDAADPGQAAQAQRFLDRILATDKAGNRHALARRMGIMYLIWDDHIYSSYDGFAKRDYTGRICDRPKDCSKTTRHRDHVHISLSHSGAAAQTTFYRARNVPSIPVLVPGTLRLDPARTAIVKVTVPATGRTVNAGFKLTRGTTYRIVGDGLYRYGAGSRVADAACRWSSTGWRPHESGLLVNGRSPWTSTCAGDHTHQATFRAPTTDYLRLRVGDERAGDNEGSLSFYVLREDLAKRSVASRPTVSAGEPRPARSAGPTGRRLQKETVTVPAAARRGRLTVGALRRKARYRVVVTGVARNGDQGFDASCVKYAGRFRPQHTLDLTKPAADHLSLFIQGVRVDLRVPRSKASCDRREHRYVGTFEPVVRGKARVRVWDPYTYDDNSGSLTVRLTRRA
jgi:hypothetical protein